LSARTIVGVAAVTYACVAANIAFDDAGTPTSAPATVAAPTTQAAQASTPPPVGDGPRVASGQPIRIAFAGDVHFEGSSRQRLAADPRTAVGPMAVELAAADLAVVNLETAVTTGGIPTPNKAFVFRSPPTAFAALRAAGVDLVNVANNHGMDYGVSGLRDTIANAEMAGMPTVGIGTDETAAYAPFITTIRGQRIAVFGATQVIDSELVATWSAGPGRPGLASAKRVDRLTAAVRAVRPSVDTVIVYLHWGVETQRCPNSTQTGLAGSLAAAGADAIVGSHAHVLQGAGWHPSGAYVAYGLGNFVFYSSGNGPNTETGVLELTVAGRAVTGATWTPGRIVGGAPRPLSDAARSSASRSWNALRSCAGLSDAPGR
jgi:poly-gamma-glutamate synthesis protein (capsule biosynthesis protein)